MSILQTGESTGGIVTNCSKNSVKNNFRWGGEKKKRKGYSAGIHAWRVEFYLKNIFHRFAEYHGNIRGGGGRWWQGGKVGAGKRGEPREGALHRGVNVIYTGRCGTHC